MPSNEQIAQVKLNANNQMDFINHVHDYLQDVINEVYDKLSEDPSYDPGQKFVTNLLDSALWSIGSFSFPGAGVISSFLGTFFGSYAGPNPPPSLSGTFGDVWARFDATFLQANDDLSAIYGDPAKYWNTSYTNPVTGKSMQVSQLGDPNVTMPDKDSTTFSSMTDKVVAAYRVALTKQTIGVKWHVLQDPKGIFMAKWSDADVANYGHGFIKQNKSFYLTWHADEGGSILCPEKGQMLLENYLGTGSDYYFGGNAPDDLCNWLFQDDQFGTVTNSKGIATRKDVFCNWGLSGSLSSAASLTKREMPAPGPQDWERAKAWHKLFATTPRHILEHQIAEKAWADPEFMMALVRNPRKTIAAELGVEFPDCVTIEVIQEMDGDYKFVIPMAGRPHQAE